MRLQIPRLPTFFPRREGPAPFLPRSPPVGPLEIETKHDLEDGSDRSDGVDPPPYLLSSDMSHLPTDTRRSLHITETHHRHVHPRYSHSSDRDMGLPVDQAQPTHGRRGETAGAALDQSSHAHAGAPISITTNVDADGTARIVRIEGEDTFIRLFLEDYKRTKEYVRELEWKVALRKALRRNLYKWYAILIIVIAISILLSVKHEPIVEFLNPLTQKIRSWPGGWLVPIALLIVVSFPPLVGHELIGVLCGLVWGLGPGFGILCAGTFIGEIAVWIAFKWLCTTRAKKFEQRNKLYSSLTQLIREKSFMFVLVLRFSAVPGHITTAVSASAGANFWAYLAAAFLTLPKQLTIAYLGTAFGTKSRKNTIISVITTLATLLATVVAAVYIYYQMRLVMRRQPVEGVANFEQEGGRGMAGNGLTLRLDLSDAGLALGRRSTIAAIHSAPYDRFGVPVVGGLGSDTEKGCVDVGAGLVLRQAGRVMDEEKGLSRARSLPGIGLGGEGGGEGVVDRARWLVDLERGEGVSRSMDGDEKEGKDGKEGKGGKAEEASVRVSYAPFESPESRSTRISQNSSIRHAPHAGHISYPSQSSQSSSQAAPRSPTPSPAPRRYPQPGSPDPPSLARPPSPAHGDLTRGTLSLDIPRSPTLRLGGREIADDADLYALSRGARRPSYGRRRGESRAALLGRPGDDSAARND